MGSSASIHQVILFVGVNPIDTAHLPQGKELEAIRNRLKQARQREYFTLEPQWAVQPLELQKAMLEFQPTIIHFSGHGKENGLVFEGESGQSNLVSRDALIKLFELFEQQIQCVLLNSCHSEGLAQAISQHIPYVIGINQSISDEAAIIFSIGFYDALGSGYNIEFAHRSGCVAMELNGDTKEKPPILIKNPNLLDEEIRKQENEILDNLVSLIKEVQLRHVRISYSEENGKCFTQPDYIAFQEANTLNIIQGELNKQEQFKELVKSLDSLSYEQQQKILTQAEKTYKKTWGELKEITPEGQTDAGQQAEKEIAGRIVSLIKRSISR